jgi:hypothetical protein
MTIQELEMAIKTLSSDDFKTFARWFDEFRADEWDRRIEEDIRAGKLDEAGLRADKDFEAGRCTPL